MIPWSCWCCSGCVKQVMFANQLKNMIFQSCTSAALQRAKQLSYCRLKIEEVGLNVTAWIPWPAPLRCPWAWPRVKHSVVQTGFNWIASLSVNTAYLHCENKVNIHTALEQHDHFPKWKQSFIFILHEIMFILLLFAFECSLKDIYTFKNNEMTFKYNGALL